MEFLDMKNIISEIMSLNGTKSTCNSKEEKNQKIVKLQV